VARGIFRFGPFRLDLAGRQLWRGEQAIGLAPKSWDLLAHLVQHPGEVLSRDQLFEALWPGIYVDDHALSVQIREIRKALGDDAQNPRYIETRHRRGYCFKAAVSRLDEPAPPAAPTQAEGAIPETRYARSGEVNIAYQVFGDGPIDMVFVMGWVSHLEYSWTEPRFAAFLRRLASFSRVILFDKRGTGLSDRVPLDQLPTIEQRMADLRAVMDAVGSSRAVICGVSEGGCMSAVFAATYPESTAALIMIGSYARRVWSEDYTWAPTPEQRQEFLKQIREEWGGPVGIEVRAPSLANDAQFRNWWATYLRMGASPGAALALTIMNTEVDIRHVLPLVGVPTLVIHRSGDQCLKVEEGRYLATHIPGARFVELPGDDHLPFAGDQSAILSEIEQFVSRASHRLEPGRALATALVLSFQEPPPDVGALVRADLEVFRATRWSVTGERVLAVFDGPARAVRCACALGRRAERSGLSMHAGLHTGQCLLSGSDVAGVAVEIAGRIQTRAGEGEILVSGTVRDLAAGAGLSFDPCGRFEARGIGEWQLLRVRMPDSEHRGYTAMAG